MQNLSSAVEAPLSSEYRFFTDGAPPLAEIDLDSRLAARRRSHAHLLKEAVVVKIGGSVLKEDADVAKAVGEIYRLRRQGRRVIAVVSAFNGQTDELFEEGRRHGCSHENRHLPRLVALGEERSSALVAMACERIGLRAAVTGPGDLGLKAEGDPLNAEPSRLDVDALADAVHDHDVVVIPGFVAHDEQGRPVLLGRGGSDLTAVFVAAEAGASVVRLIKDVDGVYESDPAVAEGQAPKRFDELTWEAARQVAGKVVQARAIDVAEARGLSIEVAALGAKSGTRIGKVSAPAKSHPHPRRLRVALAGCGVVGGGVYERLALESDAYEVVSVLVRNVHKNRDVAVPVELQTADVDEFFASQPDVVVDAVADGDLGALLAKRALEAGLGVASANKQAVVTDLKGLHDAARRTGAPLAFSGAVGGGCPMVETVRLAREHGPIVSFEAVLNGTVNFILDRLAAGVDFPQALEEARAAGFAEEDPSADLDGLDAAAKVRILAYEAFGEVVDDEHLPRRKLDEAALADYAKTGGVWRQVGECVRKGDNLKAEVHLGAVDQNSPFALLRRERNALRVVTEDGREFIAHGRGAGRWPTAEAVVSDLADVRAVVLDV